MKSPRILCSLAIAALAGGLLSLGATVRAWPEHQRHLEQKVSALQALDRLAATREGVAAREALDKLPSQAPRPLANLVRDVDATLEPALQQRDRVDLGHGWSGLTFGLTFEQIDLPQLGQILEHTGAARPPWRLREITVRALENQPGRARVEMTLEALSKP